MINLKQTNLIGMTKEELLEIATQEVQEYQEARQYNQVYQNIPRLKNLEAIEKRLGAYALGDENVINTRRVIKDLLNQDVYKKTTPPKATTNYSNYEDYINARLRSR